MTSTAIVISAIIFGAVFGLFVTASIVLTYRLGRSRTSLGWLGLAGGLTIALGFAVFRAHMAIDRKDLLIAAGFAIVEVGAILTLEWVGTHMRRVYAEWVAKRAEFDEASGILAASIEEARRRRANLNELRAAMDAQVQYVEERLIRRVRAPELEDAAVRAVREGYLAGIDANRQPVQAA